MPPRPGQDGTYECYRRRNEPRDDKHCCSHGGGQHRHEHDPSEREHRKRPTRSAVGDAGIYYLRVRACCSRPHKVANGLLVSAPPLYSQTTS